MLTVAYCRVSTEEQAADGFSIDGQADRLRVYAELHELGEVTVIADPGLSGKDLNRPGLQRVLAMVEDGHVANVLTWRLDRLSRNLSDLILLADQFGQHGVALHSFTEKLDLSSATGRMFYNILGSFAQFYREQLAENVRMGIHQAIRQGRWVNRPPTGYDLVAGILTPNEVAPIVRQVFRMRGSGASQGDIATTLDLNYSTVLAILRNRAYLGEIRLHEEWYPGLHEPLVTAGEFEAAHRGRVKGRRRGRDLMSGRVRCGLCQRVMTVEDNGRGHLAYRCRHRGQGCRLPRRSANGLLRASVLGLRLLSQDEELRQAIRRQLARGRMPAPKAGRSPRQVEVDSQLASLQQQRRKLLGLFYGDQIGADLFAEEERRLTHQIEAVSSAVGQTATAEAEADDLASRFEEVADLLAQLDVDSIWNEADETERRVLLDELVHQVEVFPDHLVVSIHGAPRLNVALHEVGLGVENSGVGGGT